MSIVLIILAVIVCVLLGFIVLIQNPKGGGLSSNFSASSQLMGVQKTGDFLEKGTWFLAIALMVLSLGINVAQKSSLGSTNNGANDDLINKVSQPTAPIAAPVQAPAVMPKAGDTTKK